MELNFHQTFKPEKAYISEILQISEEVQNMSLDQLSNITGIPQGTSSGKLVPHLKYAKIMGLLDYSISNGLYTIKLSNLGELIKAEDISLSENITLLLLQHNIIKKTTGADLWSFCFIDYLNKYGKRSKYEYFLNESEQRFGKIKYGPFLKSYEELFLPLNLLQIDLKNNSLIFNNFTYNREYYPVMGYIFYDLWDNMFPGEMEITNNQLNDLLFRNRFAWSKDEESEALECLSEYGLLRLNKQLMPYTIIRLNDTEYIMRRLYSELI